MEYQKTIFTQKQGGEILGVVLAVFVEPQLTYLHAYPPTYLSTYLPTHRPTSVEEHPQGVILETCDL